MSATSGAGSAVSSAAQSGDPSAITTTCAGAVEIDATAHNSNNERSISPWLFLVFIVW